MASAVPPTSGATLHPCVSMHKGSISLASMLTFTTVPPSLTGSVYTGDTGALATADHAPHPLDILMGPVFSMPQPSAFTSPTPTVFALPTSPAFTSSDIDQPCLDTVAHLSLANTLGYSLALTLTHQYLCFSHFQPSLHILAHLGTQPHLPPPSRISLNPNNLRFI